MENSPTSNLESKNTKELAINAYKKFIDKGIKSPDSLNLDDTEVIEANNLFYKWQRELDFEAGDNQEKQIRNDLAKTMFYVDAGFTDKGYLEEVLEEFLFSESDNAEKKEGDLEREITRNKIAEEIKKIKSILKSQR